jgi:MFS family permease
MNVAGYKRLLQKPVVESTAGKTLDLCKHSNTRSWFALGVIIIAFYAGALNQQILILSMESLKLELGLTDTQIGFLFSTPGICAGLGALLLGVLADRAPRHIVLCGSILVWSIATAGLGFATQFMGIFMGIVALAFGESALGPVVNSIVPDLFSEQKRVTVNLILAGATVIGAGVATLAAANLIAWIETNQHIFNENMRFSSTSRGAFFIAGLIGLPIAVAVLCIGNIKRKLQTTQKTSDIRNYMHRHGRAILGIYSALAIQSAGVVALSTWIPTYLTRRFEMSMASVGTAVGTIVIAGSVLGIGLSMMITRWIFPKYGLRTTHIIYFCGVLAAIIPTAMQTMSENSETSMYLTFVTVCFLTMATGHTASMLQDVSPAQLRGRVFAVATLFMSVVPAGSPALVGILSDSSGNSSMSLIYAISTVATACFMLSILVLYLSRHAILDTINDLKPN